MSEAPELPFKWTRMPDGTLRVRLYGLCVGGVRPVPGYSPQTWFGWVHALDRGLENVGVDYSEKNAMEAVSITVKSLADPGYKVKKTA